MTRWTVRANSLKSIDTNHFRLLNLFVEIISDKTEKRGLDAEKTCEVIGLIAYLQKFEFIFGIKLNIVMYKEVDDIAKQMQGDKVSISNAIQFVKRLLTTLNEEQNNFDLFWDNVSNSRTSLNMAIQNITLLRECGQVDEVEEATCPRACTLQMHLFVS